MKITTLTRPVVLVAALAVVAVLVLAACGSPSNANAGSGGTAGGSTATPAGGGATTNQIVIRNFTFTPSTTTVSAGTKVTWTNQDSTIHDVTSASGPGTGATPTSLFTSGNLAQGKTFSYTFKNPGTYYYECKIHAALASMHAVVIVK
jgi:plastocyanin